MHLFSSLNSRILICLFILLCFSWSCLCAQPDGFKALNISVEDGLSENTVLCTIQDSLGYIWIGTQKGGLDRYDGYSFKHHRVNPYDSSSICSNEVIALLEDSRGHIWVGSTNDGISVYDPKNENFTNYTVNKEDSTSLIGNNNSCFVEDSIGRIWVATDRGLCFYDYESDGFTPVYKNSKKGKFARVTSIALYDNDHLIVSEFYRGLSLYNITTQKVEKKWRRDKKNKTSLAHNASVRLIVDSEKRIWCAPKKGGLSMLASIDSDVFLHMSYDRNSKHSIASQYVRDIIQDKRGDIWAATSAGLSFLSKEESYSYTPKFINYTSSEDDIFGLSFFQLNSICEDRHGELWVGNRNAGVDYVNIKPATFKLYRYKLNDDKCINNPRVNALYKDDREIIVGTHGGGLNVFDIKTQKYSYYNTNKSIDGTYVRSLFTNSEGYFFVGTTSGIHLFNRKDKSFKPSFKKTDVRQIDEGPNHLWVCTREGAYVVDKRRRGNNPYKYKQSDYEKINKGGGESFAQR
ncbi:hypothetical protein OAA06_00495 [bacterium]|nr:hypothetical protein [bacterium]